MAIKKYKLSKLLSLPFALIIINSGAEKLEAGSPNFTLAFSNGVSYLKPQRPQRPNVPLKSSPIEGFPGQVLHFTFTNNPGQDYGAPNTQNAVLVKQEQFYGCAVNSNGEIIPNTAYHWWSNPAPTFTNFSPPYSISAISLASTHLLSATTDGRIQKNYLHSGWVPEGAQIPSIFTFPNQNRKIVDLLTATDYTIFLLENGTVDGWGTGYTSWRTANPHQGQTDNIVAIEGNETFIVVLKGDGTINVHALDEYTGQAVKNATPSNLTNIVSISASKSHIMTLDGNGAIRTWGLSPADIGSNPRPTRRDVVAIATGSYGGPSSCALYEDGSLVVWSGDGSMTNNYGDLGVYPSSISFNGRNGFVIIPEKSTMNYLAKLGTKFRDDGVSVGISEGVNDVLESPNDFDLYTQDQLNDVESQAETEGWMHGRMEVLNNPTAFNLYTPTSIQDLRMGGLIMQKGASNTVNLKLKLLQSSNMTNWSQADEITWQLPLTNNKQFLRINTAQ
jgi:hypothetical protein